MKFQYFLFINTLLASSMALAHTGLKSSSLSDQAQLTDSPQTLDLHFKSAVRLVKLTLKEQANTDYNLGFAFNAKAAEQYQYSLPKLPANTYTVSWVIMNKDLHKKSGTFSFVMSNTNPKVTDTK